MTNHSKIIAITIIGFLVSCDRSGLDGKKDELYSLRDERKSLDKKIRSLQEDIKKEDPAFEAVRENTTLVSVITVTKKEFQHRFEVRGGIASRKNILVSAEVPGVVNQIKIREGQRVKKGEVMIVVDSESIRRNMDELKTQLDLAQIIFERQSRLWDQGVGSEIQYLEAKNRKESIDRRLASARTQLAKTKIRAPFSGTIDNVSIKEGEFVMTGFPLIRVVSLSSLYIDADVSERFIGKLKKGDKVSVHFPSADQRLVSKIVAVSDVINRDNRTFKVEVDLNTTNIPVKPNMVVILEMTDYRNKEAVVLPTNIIQRDDVGTFIYSVKDTNGKKVAKKLHVKTGVSFESETEIQEGVSEGIVVVNDGFRELSEGTVIEIANQIISWK
jgi:membrane fusion protein, multidrug efflux system